MSLKAAKAHNSKFNLQSQKAMVVGGTSGIGEGIALKLASLKADVTIAGRNKTSAERVLARLKQAHPTGTHAFVPIDISLMREVKSFAQKYKEEHKQLNYLVVSSGIMTMQGRTETVEGIDQKLAIHYYGRWFLINELLPLLEDDFDLKKHYGLREAANVAPFHNDLMVEEFSLRHPKLPFMHAFPGFVDTPLATKDTLPWYVRLGAKLASPFGTSLEDCGEYMTYGLLADEHKKGWSLLTSKGKSCDKLKAHTDDMRKKVWDHTEKLVAQALANSRD